MNCRLLGESGRCFAFDDRAQGYGRGEGVGAVIIKPLSKALEDGDSIRAVIRNTAVNQDGRTSGITMPNGSAQEALIQKAYTEAGLDPKTTGYVEAHGTGTAVGDAVEAEAIAAVFSKGRQSDSPVMVGSIKTNIGHTEGTAGMAGLIKTTLMLEKGKILPNYDFKKLSDRMPETVSHIQASRLNPPAPNTIDKDLGTQDRLAVADSRFTSCISKQLRVRRHECTRGTRCRRNLPGYSMAETEAPWLSASFVNRDFRCGAPE